MSILGERIREARIAYGISSSELARAIGVTSAAVSRWENDLVKNLKMEHLFSIARLLNINPEWLATGRGEKSELFHEKMVTEPTSVYSALSEDEQRWLNAFRKLSPSCRKSLQQAVSDWASGNS